MKTITSQLTKLQKQYMFTTILLCISPFLFITWLKLNLNGSFSLSEVLAKDAFSTINFLIMSLNPFVGYIVFIQIDRFNQDENKTSIFLNFFLLGIAQLVVTNIPFAMLLFYLSYKTGTSYSKAIETSVLKRLESLLFDKKVAGSLGILLFSLFIFSLLVKIRFF